MKGPVEIYFHCSRTGRMEAKGCAKPAVWKEARRHFYWAVRARISRSTLLAELAEASPESTPEYRSRLLNSIAFVDKTTDPRAAADALEKLDIAPTVAQLKSDYLMRRLLDMAQQDRKAMIGSLTRLADNLSEDDRSSLITALQSASRSPGKQPNGVPNSSLRC
jgi:acetyl-CoA carboxylase/biotin carboxylase 1